MKLIKMQCPNCGATLSVDENAEKAVCEYCGAVVPVEKQKAKVTVKHRKISRKAFVIFSVAAACLVIAAVAVVLSVTGKARVGSNVYKAAGVYLVGEDIPAGEYILYPNVKESDGDVTPVFEIRKTKDAATNSSDFICRKEFYMRQYVNLNDGEYIAFEYSLMYLPEKVKLRSLDEKGYAAAQLKVGDDIEAGEYVIVGENKQTQYFITSKPEIKTTDLNSPDMLKFDYCENRIYLKVKDGEYLTFAGGRLYKPSDAPALGKTESGALKPGQYKVGKDILSGNYSVVSAENRKSQAWACVNKNATNTGRVNSWEHELIAAGGETLTFLRLEDCDEPARINIPACGDGEELYVTFWYCFATAL